MVKPDEMKLNTWYKSSNIMMYPYIRHEDETVHHYNGTFYGDKFSMITVQTITHFGPKRWEWEDTDMWEIHVDEKWKKSNVDPDVEIRNYLYWDEKEHVIEDRDIELPNKQDFYRLIHSIFKYQEGWS